jgi:hypothetical protein
VDNRHDPVCCALNRDIFFPPGSGPGPGTGAFACCDSRAKLEAGSTVGGRVGRRDDDVGKGGALAGPGVCGGNDGESMILTTAAGLLRSKTVSLIAAEAPSRGPSSSSATKVRGGAGGGGGGGGDGALL